MVVDTWGWGTAPKLSWGGVKGHQELPVLQHPVLLAKKESWCISGVGVFSVRLWSGPRIRSCKCVFPKLPTHANLAHHTRILKLLILLTKLVASNCLSMAPCGAAASLSQCRGGCLGGHPPWCGHPALHWGLWPRLQLRSPLHCSLSFRSFSPVHQGCG